jgi:hypothetical protein
MVFTTPWLSVLSCDTDERLVDLVEAFCVTRQSVRWNDFFCWPTASLMRRWKWVSLALGGSYTEETSCMNSVACKKSHVNSFLLINTQEELPWPQSSSRHQTKRMFCSFIDGDVDEKANDDIGYVAATLWIYRARTHIAKELNVDEKKFRYFYRISQSSFRTSCVCLSQRWRKRTPVSSEKRLRIVCTFL